MFSPNIRVPQRSPSQSAPTFQSRAAKRLTRGESGQRLVERSRFFRDLISAEEFLRAFAAGLAKFFGQLSIFHELIDPARKIAREFFRICELERALDEVDRNKKSSLAVDDNFLDSANCARDDRRFTRHRFEINDAERFV